MNLHEKAQAYILAHIQGGDWAVGAQIPTEQELTQQLGISRPTLRQALARLTDAGVLTRVQGRGTFVAAPKVRHESTSMLWSYGAESASHGHRLKTQVLSLGVEKPSAMVSDRLGLSGNKKVCTLVRIRWLEGVNQGKPVVLTQVHVPASLFPGMEALDFTNASFYEEMEQAGLGIRRATRELEVESPGKERAQLLEISPLEPVIHITTLGFLENGKAAEYAESWYPASCSKFEIQVVR